MYLSLFPFSFSCFEHIECLPVIFWFWKFYVPIWALPIFSEIWETYSFIHDAFFLYGIFFCIALYIAWKPPHVQCKNKMFVNFGFVLITYIPFPFPFSLLYNSSSFYQCLYFVWHLVMYKLLTKILLSPSFCLKCSIPY